jgi:hypothetical protein
VQVHGGVNEVVAFSGTVQAGQVQGIKAARPMPARRPDQMTRFFTLPTAPAGRSLCEGDTLRTPVLFTAVTTGSRGRWTISHLLLRLAGASRLPVVALLSRSASRCTHPAAFSLASSTARRFGWGEARRQGDARTEL